MAIIRLPDFMAWPTNTIFTNNYESGAMTASEHKLFAYGKVSCMPFTGTKTIKCLHGRWGTCVVTSGTRIKVEADSILDTAYSTPAGAPFREIASWDVSGISTGNAFFTTPDFTDVGGGHAVSYDEYLGFVFSFATFEATNSIKLYGSGNPYGAYCGLYTTSWTSSLNTTPSIAIEFTDGTFATLALGDFAPSVYLATAVNNEFGNQFTSNAPLEVAGVAIATRNASTPSAALTFDLRLLKASSVVATSSRPVAMSYNTSIGQNWRGLFATPIVLQPGVVYQATCRRSDGGGGFYQYRRSLISQAIKEATIGKVSMVSRANDAASFTVDDTSVASVSLLISGVHDGVTGFF